MELFRQDLIALAQSPLQHWLTVLPAQLAQWQQSQLHGEWSGWYNSIRQLPRIEPQQVELGATIRVSNPQLSAGQQARTEGLLRQLMPWRKGPFELHGVSIDTEWRSDFKWARIAPHLGSLAGQQVLDVGCGSGYHLWRMLEAGAEQAWGIDPGQLFLAQFLAVRHFMPLELQQRAHLFPIGVDDLPALSAFDTVFCMGVLYHRRSPIELLQQLHQQLKVGGRLILETLVVAGDAQTVLMPGQSYGKMRNVWFIPSTAALLQWLQRCRFSQLEVLDEAPTSIAEQRRTAWMEGQSLADFLDPDDPSKTIEGYPAPRRVVISARV